MDLRNAFIKFSPGNRHRFSSGLMLLALVGCSNHTAFDATTAAQPSAPASTSADATGQEPTLAGPGEPAITTPGTAPGNPPTNATDATAAGAGASATHGVTTDASTNGTPANPAPGTPPSNIPLPPPVNPVLPPPPPPNINFGLMVNDLNCTFCHLEVHGTVNSVATVPPFRDDSYGTVYGRWLVNGAFNAAADLYNPPNMGGMVVTAGAVTNYNNVGKELPVDPTTATVAMPTLNLTSLATTVQGTLTGNPQSSPRAVREVYAGNVLMIGTQTDPITISRDVVIQGDLVITGYYTGVGTIYVQGNIYMPSDLKALNLASFPYSDDPATAKTQAQADLAAGNKDALGLATLKSIYVGDLENYMDSGNGPTGATGPDGTQYVSIYDPGGSPPPLLQKSTNGMDSVYTWLPETQYEKLYTDGTPCTTNTPDRTLVSGHHWGERVFSEIDAYLYAGGAIAGIDRTHNWTINGGMISQLMHIVSGAGFNPPCSASRINFDYRMSNGLQVLEALAPFFSSSP